MTKQFLYLYLTLAISFMSPYVASAQKKYRVLHEKEASKEVPGAQTIHFIDESPRLIVFKENQVESSEFIPNIAKHLKLGAAVTFALQKSESDQLGMVHTKLQQRYKNLDVDGLEYIVHEKVGKASSCNGRVARESHINIDTNPSLSESQAFAIALSNTNARTEDQQSKSGMLMITSKNYSYDPGSYRLVYKFFVFVSPSEQWWVFVDAHTGDIVNKLTKVMSCFSAPLPPPLYVNGTGQTNYYGTQNIKTEQINGSFRLRGQTGSGGLIETYDMHSQGDFNLATDFEDADNNFTDANALAGVTAHWGTEKTYEYFKNVHSRNSFDNMGGVMKSYVHGYSNWANASCDGTKTLFGDGSGTGPWVPLDVVGHEWTHAVTYHSSKLISQNESGALNESFSDIFGKAIEFSVPGLQPDWLHGSKIFGGASAVRSYSNPNAYNQPDTYFGAHWSTGLGDNGGVHINDGVQNFWFYLLSNGGSGTNDNGFNYNVPVVGIDTTAVIAYRNLTKYLFSSAEYIDSRFGSLLATVDLYGNGAVYNSVASAWDAVGVIDEPFILNVTVTDVTGSTATLNAKVKPDKSSTTVQFEYGLTPAYGSITTPVNIGNANAFIDVSASISGLAAQSLYYVRVAATNQNGTSYKGATFNTLDLTPLLINETATEVTSTTAVLHGQVNPNNSATSYHFEYGLTQNFGQVTTINNLASGTIYSPIQIPVSGLTQYQKYFYRLVATNAAGTSTSNTLTFWTYNKPILFSINPSKAVVGSSLTITGSNFNPVATNNIVHFGSVKATVVSGSATSLQVVVPFGASFGPITVTNQEAGLTGMSQEDFNPLFGGRFSASAPAMQYSGTKTCGVAPVRNFISDFDDDHKPDILLLNSFDAPSILKNNHSTGALSVNSFTWLGYIPTVNNNAIGGAVVDLNGDGKKDIIISTFYGFAANLNLSTLNNISFGPQVNVAIEGNTGFNIRDVAAADFDGNGTIDIAVENISTKSIEIYRNDHQNVNALDVAHFVKKATLPLNYGITGMTVTDVDKDGKPDILIGLNKTGQFFVFHNETTSSSNFVFSQLNSNLPSQALNFTNFAIGDLNEDGKRDISAVVQSDNAQFGVFQNESMPGSYVLSNYVSAGGFDGTRDIDVADMDGNGRADLVVGIVEPAFKIFSNQIGVGSFITPAGLQDVGNFSSGANGTVLNNGGLSVNDLNFDGKPDVVNSPGNGPYIEIYENTLCAFRSSGIVASNITFTSAQINWDDMDGAGNYILEYSIFNSGSWNSVTVIGSTSQTLSITPGKYQVRIKRICSPNNFSDWYYTEFTTPYCDSKGQNSSTDWIDLVQISDLSNPSGNDGGYKFYNNVTVPNLTRSNGAFSSGVYTLSFSAGFSLLQFHTEYWKVWIDFNQDGDFLDQNEQVMSTSTFSQGTSSITITIPADASLGATRMRVSMKYGAAPLSPCEMFSNGEVEDYLVNISISGGSPARMQLSASENSAAPETGAEAFYPNPVQAVLHLQAKEYEGGTILITDIKGNIIRSTCFMDHVDLSELPPGMYILTLKKGTLISRKKFVKE